MTNLKNKYFSVLDKGFIALKDYMGSDEDIEQAARISFGKDTRKVSDTRDLIRYLIRNEHLSPVEMCECKFHIRLPMDCNRQLVRHRMCSMNEASSRYSEVLFLCKETPQDSWRLQSKNNKQGSSGFLSNPIDCEMLNDKEKRFHQIAFDVYNERLGIGIAREQARKDLPLSTYTELFWKMDLRNLLHFLKLRCDSHAQLEIRQYAYIIAGIIKELFPITFEAWKDYIFCAKTFSKIELKLIPIYYCCRDQLEEYPDWNLLSKREQKEFLNKLNDDNNEEINFDLDTSLIKNYSSFY
jgi:thymidylate synthase (FAD)